MEQHARCQGYLKINGRINCQHEIFRPVGALEKSKSVINRSYFKLLLCGVRGRREVFYQIIKGNTRLISDYKQKSLLPWLLQPRHMELNWKGKSKLRAGQTSPGRG